MSSSPRSFALTIAVLAGVILVLAGPVLCVFGRDTAQLLNLQGSGFKATAGTIGGMMLLCGTILLVAALAKIQPGTRIFAHSEPSWFERWKNPLIIGLIIAAVCTMVFLFRPA